VIRVAVTCLFVALAAAASSSCHVGSKRDAGDRAALPQPTPRLLAFEATAYSIEGKTATGRPSGEGIVAADPRVLPLGTQIRVHDAGEYSGEYLVSDTGRTVKGQEIDIYVGNDSEAKRFGRRNVKVEVVSAAR
jgi:3D (Asp-Asp-Asp) domain-containing protein